MVKEKNTKTKTLNRFDVCLVNLDPTIGSEIKKTRPCVIVSPDEANRHLKTVVIVPLTSTLRELPTRIPVEFKGKSGNLVIDQIRTVDKKRLISFMGRIDIEVAQELCKTLIKFFTL